MSAIQNGDPMKVFATVQKCTPKVLTMLLNAMHCNGVALALKGLEFSVNL